MAGLAIGYDGIRRPCRGSIRLGYFSPGGFRQRLIAKTPAGVKELGRDDPATGDHSSPKQADRFGIEPVLNQLYPRMQQLRRVIC